MLLSSEGVLCVCGFAQLARLFPSCSIALAAAAERLSCPRILFCTFYPKSVQEHCPFSLTVNIVTALTNIKGSRAMSGLKHTIWQFWGIFLGSASLSLSAFRSKTFTILSCYIMSGWVKMEQDHSAGCSCSSTRYSVHHMVIDSCLRLLMVKLKAHRVNWKLMFSVIVVGRITRCRRQTACGRRARSTAAHQITASTPRNAKWTTKTAWADMWVFIGCYCSWGPELVFARILIN